MSYKFAQKYRYILSYIIPTQNHASDAPDNSDGLPSLIAELKKLCRSYEKKLSKKDEKIQALDHELSMMKMEKKALLQKLRALVKEIDN